MHYDSIWSGGLSQELPCCRGPLSLKEEGRGVWELGWLSCNVCMEAI